jgi:hypothetical protein
MMQPTRQSIETAYPARELVMMVAAPITGPSGQRVLGHSGDSVPLFSAWLAGE